jgi:transcriptional regulator with XRE-family HTH domain
VPQVRFEFAKEMLARNLRGLRVARHLSQEKLGRKAGISQAQISAIGTRKGNPTIDSLQRIADVLGIAMSALFVEHK